MAEIIIGGKKAEDLKVLELKEELGKRGLQKTGKKHALVKRLIEAILKEQIPEQVSSWVRTGLITAKLLLSACRIVSKL